MGSNKLAIGATRVMRITGFMGFVVLAGCISRTADEYCQSAWMHLQEGNFDDAAVRVSKASTRVWGQPPSSVRRAKLDGAAIYPEVRLHVGHQPTAKRLAALGGTAEAAVPTRARHDPDLAHDAAKHIPG
jgi:hypothetical protein